MFPSLLVSISSKTLDVFEGSFSLFSFLSIIFFWTGFQTARVTSAGVVSHCAELDQLPASVREKIQFFPLRSSLLFISV